MPTLLSINNYYYQRGGAETVFISHNHIFEELKWRVIPFSMHHPKNMETPWKKYFIENIEYGDTTYTWWDKIRRAPKTIYSLEARNQLSRLLDEQKPDICHLHNIYHHISPSILSLLKERELPVALTLHDLKIACPAYQMLTHDGICERCIKGRIYNVILHRCIKNSYSLSMLVAAEALMTSILGSYSNNVDKFVAPSRFYLDKMIEWGWDRSRFIHIPNFVRHSLFKPEYQVGKSFIYFGRLSREKGIETLIRAAAKSGVSLSLVGSGPEEQSLRHLATNIGCKVDFYGYLSGTALHDAINASRAVVLPSQWYENAPMSILESYSLGKPVIGSSIGGIPELIRDGETGSTFIAGSVDNLASVLSDYTQFSDKKLIDMGRAGRLWVEADYSLTRYRDRMLALYSDLGVCN